jgi:S-adenosylmethionine:diacylglycerol 3-amino-3-carboxypropyl transferase
MARFEYQPARSKELHEQDRSAIYGMFHIYQLRDAAGSGTT